MIDENSGLLENETVKEPDDNKTSGANMSCWFATTQPLSFKPLDTDINVDVAVIGAGISGITCAFMLTRAGKSVAVIEDGNVASGESGRTTAHFVNALDDRYYEIEKIFGLTGSKLIAESHTAAINLVEAIIGEEGIECEFRRLDGYLFLHPNDKRKNIENEYLAAKRAGIHVEVVDEMPGIKNGSSYYIKFLNQAALHPIKYLNGLCQSIEARGGRIFTHTHAEKVDATGVTTSGNHKVNAKHIIVATNTPFNNQFIMHTKEAPYRTYVIAGRVKKGIVPDALWWDTGDHESKWSIHPYHYVRLASYSREYDLIISGGEDHKTGQPDEDGHGENERFDALEKWTKFHFPDMEDVMFRWSGQVLEPVDSIGYIGRNPLDSDNIFIVTGDSGNGMTHGTLAGIIIPDLINGVENNLAELYDPARKTLKTIDTFIEEQVNVAKQYGAYLTTGDIDSLQELKPGQGAVMKDGASKSAVYRDESGKIFAYSAVCPHLKCIVDWNETEKTFDCPCHGSRFTCYGKVINGPANTGLEEKGIPE